MLKLVNEMLFMQILFVCVTSIYDRRKFRCYLLVLSMCIAGTLLGVSDFFFFILFFYKKKTINREPPHISRICENHKNLKKFDFYLIVFLTGISLFLRSPYLKIPLRSCDAHGLVTLESILIFFLTAQNRKVLFEYSNVIAFGNHCLNIQLPRHFLLIVLVTENHYI